MIIFFSKRNTAQVSGGERELRTMYLPPFQKACLESLSIMTAYSSYDGIPAVANKRKYPLFSIVSVVCLLYHLTFADLLTDIVCCLFPSSLYSDH
jgi:hypothetical protein